MKIVVALGGNALTKKGEKGAYKELIKNIKKTSKNLIDIIKDNKVIIVSGSGPQVGALVLQNELSKKKVPEMPLNVLDAELEGELGYMIELALNNELKKSKRKSVTVLTQVLVDKNDKGFKNPTKPIGLFYSEKEAEKLRKKGFKIIYQVGKGYRRVVASPTPLEIIEINQIKDLMEKGNIVIAAGGGGIPVYRSDKGLKGIDAVIDKDRASSLLARNIKADLLLILTDVDKVALNYKEKNQKFLNKLSVKDAKKYLKEGHFKEGSMKPKIEASINFLENGGKKVIITSISKVKKGLKDGTLIVK
ncbi:carbamate kinase [Candidatus Woesearchaeota archaeon]|nr:carbamate kinase [Candidatus Woesearchaeota archaeon]